MKASEGLVVFFIGLAFFAGIGVLIARRIVMMAFSLGLMLMAIAGIYATIGLQAAFFTQMVLYIGGVLVLIGMTLHLYPDAPGKIQLNKSRESLGKGFIMLFLMAVCLFFAPWESISGWSSEELKGNREPITSVLSIKDAGKYFISNFPFEFEWLGILMLTGLLVSGWFLKDILYSEKK